MGINYDDCGISIGKRKGKLKMAEANKINLEDYITSIPDYPEPGVVFKDITPLLASPVAFKAAIDRIVGHFGGTKIDKVIGAEARGFIMGTPVAYQLNAGFIPARKPGKLPRATISQEYDLEYGTATIHIHEDALSKGENVLIVDDLIATGGTAVAQAKLIEQAGANLVGMAFLMELEFLNPRKLLAQEIETDVLSLIKVK